MENSPIYSNTDQPTRSLSKRKRLLIIIASAVAIILLSAPFIWAAVSKPSEQTDESSETSSSTRSAHNYDTKEESSDLEDPDNSDDKGKKDAKDKSKTSKSSKSSNTTSGSKSSSKSSKTASSSTGGSSPGRQSGGGSNGGGGSSGGNQSPKRPLLIKHGWDIPYVNFVVNNSSGMMNTPFDGTVIRTSHSSNIMSPRPVSYSTLSNALSPLANTEFQKKKHNLYMIYKTPGGDMFDDWSTVINNFKNATRAAKEAGFKGIFFDNEAYDHDGDGSTANNLALHYPENCSGGQTLSQCRDRAFLRGSQIMNGIISEWPEAKIIIALGTYHSDPRTGDYLNSRGVLYNPISQHNLLSGSFSIGLASSTVGTKAQFIDGGEIYSARSVSHFDSIKYWQKQGMAGSSLVPSSLKPQWANIVSSSFGVYDVGTTDGYYWSGGPMNASIWESTLSNALSVADHYVWAYTEKYDWWGTGWPLDRAPASWVDATRRAVAN